MAARSARSARTVARWRSLETMLGDARDLLSQRLGEGVNRPATARPLLQAELGGDRGGGGSTEMPVDGRDARSGSFQAVTAVRCTHRFAAADLAAVDGSRQAGHRAAEAGSQTNPSALGQQR